jgi:hypothetical protein
MSDETEVRAVIADYFEALYHGDVTKFRQVLHPLVRLTSATDGVLINLDLETYMGMVAGRPSPASRNDPRDEGILSIEVSSSTTAHARLKDMYMPKRFVNEITFIKIDGRWQVIAKVWHFSL